MSAHEKQHEITREKSIAIPVKISFPSLLFVINCNLISKFHGSPELCPISYSPGKSKRHL